MDDTDPDIKFDDAGVSNHARHAQWRLENECFRTEAGSKVLEGLAEQIKKDGQGKEYDCILGVSGGADSSYVAVKAHQLGLRPLAVHLDNGWNSELAVANIERLLRAYNLDLYTHVIDWEEFRDVQRCLFLASVTNVEVATDHAIFALLYKIAAKYQVKYILSGSNVETESIMPDAWSHEPRDSKSLKAIQRKFGRKRSLKTFPFLSPVEFIYFVFVKGIKLFPILNYGPYNKSDAIKKMTAEWGYKPYVRKHGESRFTRFFQEYYLVEKFGFDKRKAHFSSMIISGQMTRDEALAELNKPLYYPEEREIDVEYVTKKLGFSASDWEKIMNTPLRHYEDYPNNSWMFDHDSRLVQFIRRKAKGE